MKLNDLKRIKAEFEAINSSYRQTFSFQGRMELIERVKKLVTAIKDFERSEHITKVS